jgi:hypothetical protein
MATRDAGPSQPFWAISSARKFASGVDSLMDCEPSPYADFGPNPQQSTLRHKIVDA